MRRWLQRLFHSSIEQCARRYGSVEARWDGRDMTTGHSLAARRDGVAARQAAHGFRSKHLTRTALLLGATLLGVLAAYWTRGDQLPARIRWFWFYGLLAHVLVLGFWTWTWASCWQSHCGTLAGRLLLWGVPLGLAITAEAAQKFLRGHVPDWIGLVYNLIGVALGLWLHRLWRPRPKTPHEAVAGCLLK